VWSFAVGPQDRVHVVDVAGRRVLVVDPEGRVLRTISVPADCRFPADVAVDGRGDVYVIDSVGRRAFAARSGEAALVAIGAPLVEDLDFPTAVAVDDDGRLFVLDEHGGGIVVLGRDGTFRGRQSAMGWKEGLLRYPVDACVDGRGSVFVAERGNSRVQRFRVE
jgi:sugar lactone lactonase YvrE